MERLRRTIAGGTAFFAFARPGNWFVSKIPPLLAVAYLEILGFGLDPRDSARLLAAGLLSIFSVAIYGHVLNDIFDLEADRLAHKVNRLDGVRPVWRVLLTTVFLISGFLPMVIVPYSRAALFVLSLNYLWPTIYSLPMTRWKEKGLLGVACDAAGSHITPTIFVLALFSSGNRPAPGPGLEAALIAVLWAAALGLKGILHHQIADRDNDIQSGIATFATARSLAAMQRFLIVLNLGIELPVSALFSVAVFPWCPLAVPAFALYVASETVKYRLGFQFALTASQATVRASLPFTNEMFYVLWMPMAAAVQLGLHAGFLWVPLIHAAVFHAPVRQQAEDWRAIIKNAARRFRAVRSTGAR